MNLLYKSKKISFVVNTFPMWNGLPEFCMGLEADWLIILNEFRGKSPGWLTSHPRTTLVLLDTGTPGTSRDIHSQDADDGNRTRNPLVLN